MKVLIKKEVIYVYYVMVHAKNVMDHHSKIVQNAIMVHFYIRMNV